MSASELLNEYFAQNINNYDSVHHTDGHKDSHQDNDMDSYHHSDSHYDNHIDSDS